MLETLFDAEEITGKIRNKCTRYMSIKQSRLTTQHKRKTKMKEPPFA